MNKELLQHPAYHQEFKLKGYTVTRTATTALTSSDAGKMLVMANRSWDKEYHQHLAEMHKTFAAQAEKLWAEEAEAACQETFGRSYEFTDYKISGIARDEFSEARKNRLRELAHGGSDHKRLAAAHQEAAKNRNRYKQ